LGEFEHYELAKRYLKRYSDIFMQKYNPLLFPVQSTQISRSSRSASAFMYSIFENRGGLGQCHFEPVSVISDSENEDFTLRFFDNCPAYTNNVLDNSTTYFNSEKYLSEQSELLVTNLIKKLMIKESCPWNVDIKDVLNIFIACAFDVSVQNKTDMFCELFEKEDIRIIEYYLDLSDYYDKGYGNLLNYAISSPLLQSFVNSIDNVLLNLDPQVANLRFAHAETVLPFLALLGLYEDVHELHWNTPPDEVLSRKWKTSNLSPFAANIAWVLYNCTSSASSPFYRVKLLHNEVEQLFPGCSELYCPYNTVKQLYQKQLAYNFDSMCGSDQLYTDQDVLFT
jgi:multiple inositol-polyphosphate phosphatase/2,3-bisphosphoglycerate 3-phosphatase